MSKCRPSHFGPAEIRVGQRGVRQICIREVGLAEIRIGQRGVFNVRIGEILAGEVPAGQIVSVQTDSGQIVGLVAGRRVELGQRNAAEIAS